MRDNVSKLGTVFNALALPALKTTITGPTIDLNGYNAATCYIQAGTWTDGTLTFAIEESDDNFSNSNAVDVSDLCAWKATSASDKTPVRVGNAQPTAISSAPTAFNQRIGYVGAKRYVRLKMTVTGSPATGCTVDAYWILSEPRFMPSAV
jgi:hypothetical protein